MVKQATTLDEQVALLEERGLLVSYPTALRAALQRNGYYRLSGYWRYHQVDPGHGDNSFCDGVTSHEVLAIIEWDSRLRSILLDGLEVVELALKAQLADTWLLATSPVGYLQPTQLAGPDPADTMRRIQSALRDSREESVMYHVKNGLEVPLWVCLCALSFGTTSKLYKSCDLTSVKQSVASALGLRDIRTAVSALEGLVVLRNVCAHRHRLWNRTGLISVAMPYAWMAPAEQKRHRRTPWALVICLRGILAELGRDDLVTQFDQFFETNAELVAGLKHPQSTGRNTNTRGDARRP